MMARCQFTWSTMLILGILAPVLLSGCRSTAASPTVLAFTGTNFGLEVSQNVATQTPQLKLGYNRGEVAIVREKDDNVLMEFGYGGTPAHSLYQRLAVGEEAVKVGTATAMFTKDTAGKVSPEAAEATKANAEALKAIKGD